MKKHTRKIITLITMVAVFCSFVISPVMAATKLSPYHLYRWAKTNNYSRLHQYKRYINLQDENQNTALCLAQQAKDRDSYITLLRFGASTDVDCHDDDDPICAIIAKEKYKLSPAWLLLGAGAAAIAFGNSGGGSSDKETPCDKEKYPHLNTCPIGQKSIDKCQDSAGTHHICACDESQNRYQDQTTCQTNSKGQIGYDCSTQEETGCFLRTELLCISPEITSCTPAKEGFILNDTETGNYAGETACHSCSYTCDISQNYIENCPSGYSCSSSTTQGSTTCSKIISCDEITQFSICPEGKNCSSTTKYGITCYQPLSDICDRTNFPYDEPCSNTTGLKTANTCTETTVDGTFTYYQCECDDNTGYYPSSTTDLKTCGTSGSNGWEFTTSQYNGITCKTCNHLSCELPSTTSCQAPQTGFIAHQTETGLFEGETPCLNCSYTCDASLYYNTTCPTGYSCSGSSITQDSTTCVKAMACDETTQFSTCPTGKTCSSSTNYGITCYKVLGDECNKTIYNTTIPCTDTTGLKIVDTCTEITEIETITYYQCACDETSGYYSSSTTDLKTCGSSGSNGWEFITGNYGSFTCKTCQMLTCGTNDYGYGAPNCPTISGLDVSSSSSSNYQGNDQCYTCQYSCGSGYYENETDCNDDASAVGKTCSPKTFTTQKGSITCYQIGNCDTSIYNFDTCPIGMTSSGSCSDTSGTHHQCVPNDCSAYEYNPCPIYTTDVAECTTNNSEGTSDQTTYQCACDATSGYYSSTASISTCGSSGSKGWEFIPLNNSPFNCKYCQEKICNTAEGFYDICPVAISGMKLTSTTSTTAYKGETACLVCSYTCDTSLNYNTTCPAGYSCTGSNISQGTTSCVKAMACDETTQFSTCPTSKTCSSSTNYGITCYKVLGDACNRTTYPYDEDCTQTNGLKTVDTCTETTQTGTSTYYQCACDETSGYYSSSTTDLKTCGSSGSNGWEFITGNYGSFTCKTCQMLTCGTNDYGYGAPNCPTVAGLDVSSSSSSDYHGNDQCYTCQYTCGTGYYDNQDDCNDDAAISGKTCSPKTFTTQKGSVTCYQIGNCDTSVYNFDNTCPTGMTETGSCSDANGTHKQCEPKDCSAFTETSCSTGTEIADSCTTNNTSGTKETTTYKCACDTDAGYYASTITDLKTCGTSGSNGWSFTTPTTISGAQCKTCQMLTCGTNDYGYGAPNCPTVAGLDVSSSSSSDYHGNDQCYTCQYTCGTGYYDNQDDCNDDAAISGKTCSPKTFTTQKGSITCYQIGNCDTSVYNFDTCPTGMTSSGSCSDTSGTHHQCVPNDCSAFTETSCSTGTTIADSCTTNNTSGTNPTTTYKCQCDTDTGYYASTITDLKTCGTSGSNGWSFTSPTTISGAQCKTCQMLTCGTNDYGYGTPNCPAVSGLDVSSSASTDYHGNDQCYTCQYSCGTGYYDNQDDCNDDAAVSGKTCSPKTFTTQKGNITCYQIGNCDTSVYNFDTCPTGMTSSGSCSDTSGTHHQCVPNDCSAFTETSCSTGTTIADSCTTNNTSGTNPTTTYKCQCDTDTGYYASTITDLKTCGSSGSNGWNFTSPTTISGQSCKTCQMLTCTGESLTETCPQNISGLTYINENIDGYSGNSPCYTCNYKCDENTYYADRTVCETNNIGKSCSAAKSFNVRGDDIICHFAANCNTDDGYATTCPTGYSCSYSADNSCAKPITCDNSSLYTECPSGKECSSSTNYGITCHTITGDKCDTSVYTYLGTSCPTGMTETGSCTDTAGTHKQCVPNDCSAFTETSCSTGTTIASSCTTRATTTSNPTTTYKCQCNTDAGYYASTITDLKTCGSTGSNGWRFTSPTTISGAQCKTCQMLTCGTNDYGYGTPNCPAVSGLDVSSSASTDYHGNDQCYTCQYSCGTGYYDNQDDCNDDAAVSGKTCSPKTFTTQKGNITCYQIGNCDTSIYTYLGTSCPSGMTSTGSCSDTNGTHHQCVPNDCSAFTFSSCTTGTTSTGSCSTRATPTGTLSTTYKCGCDSSNGYYGSGTTASVCGTSGTKGWELTSGTYNTLTCSTCSELDCNNASGYYDTCPAAKTGLTLKSTASTTAYTGNTQCYTCSYTCNGTTHYTTESACETANSGKTCSSTSITHANGSTTCYVVNGCDSSIYNYAGTSCPTGMISAGSCTHNGTTYQDCNPINCSAYPQATCNTGTEIASSCTTRATPTSTPTTTYTCSCDTDAGYYASTITDLKTCGTSGSNGWEFTTPTTISGAQCKTCQMLTCGTNDYGYGTPNCPAVSGLDVSSSASTDYHGNDQCYTCQYSCGTGYYDNQDDCNDDAAVSGKTCSPKTFTTQKGNITCYQIGNCDTSIYTYLGTSCPSGMTSTGSCSDTNGTHHQCVPNDCSAFTFSNCTTGTTSTGSCTTRATTTSSPTTTYKCECDTTNGYYKSTASLTVCGSTGANGWEFNTGTYNTLTCKTCSALECDNSKKDYEGECPTPKTGFELLVESTSTNATGNTYCKYCSYGCDANNGYFSSCPTGYVCNSSVTEHYKTCVIPTACDEVNYFTTCPEGKVCLTNSNWGLQCYYITGDACDKTIYTSLTDCSKTTGLKTIGTCQENALIYYQCACDDTQGYYASTITDLKTCGTSGANGWHFTTSTQNGITCKQCEENSCPVNTTAETCKNNYSYIEYDSSSTTGITEYSGDTQCHTCNYTCKTGYYQDENECIDDNDECSLYTTTETQSNQTYYCYAPSYASLNTTLEKTTNTQKLTKTSYGSEDVYGMSSESDMKNTSNSINTSTGQINITHNSTGSAYGMYGSSSNSLLNDTNAEINISTTSNGKSVGIYASRGGSVINKGNISLTGDASTAIGILGEGENYIENSGTIDVSGQNAYGIRVLDGTSTEIINSGSININATNEAYGIYVDQNASANTVTNTGTITINGNQNDTSRSIVLNGAEFRNRGMMSVSGNLNLNTFGASRVYLEDGATYEAESLEGDLTAGTSTVMNNNLDTYVEKSAIKANSTENLNISSESALFNAKTQNNQDGTTDVVLERKDFSDFTPNSSIANALTKDYQAGKFEETFNNLKTLSSIPALNASLAKTTGIDTFLNFRDENFQVLKNLNRTMADTIFKPTNEQNRVIAGYANYDLETEDKGLLSGYELNSRSMFSFADKRLNNWSRLGLGISFTDLDSTYEKGGDRDLNIVSIFVPYLRKINDKLNLVSILNVGYGYGDYERTSKLESDIEQIIYGITNELRYTINLNGFAELEPALMLNALGYYEKGYNEGNETNALESKSTNNLSVELGAGLYLKKEMSVNQYGKLGFKVGGAYYHEFADPYNDMTIHLKGGNWYKLNDYANIYQRDRAVLEAIIDYAYKDLSMYLKYNKLIQKNNPDLFDMGIKYNF